MSVESCGYTQVQKILVYTLYRDKDSNAVLARDTLCVSYGALSLFREGIDRV